MALLKLVGYIAIICFAIICYVWGRELPKCKRKPAGRRSSHWPGGGGEGEVSRSSDRSEGAGLRTGVAFKQDSVMLKMVLYSPFHSLINSTQRSNKVSPPTSRSADEELSRAPVGV